MKSSPLASLLSALIHSKTKKKSEYLPTQSFQNINACDKGQASGGFVVGEPSSHNHPRFRRDGGSKVVGHKSERKNHLTLKLHGEHDLSKPNRDNGLVRFGPNASMESHIPPDPLQPVTWLPSLVRPDMASLAKPMVDLSLK